MVAGRNLGLAVLFVAFICSVEQYAAPRKPHAVALGVAKKVPYSKIGDPAGASAGEDVLKIRPLVVDGAIKEWTTGDAHDMTDRSFVVRRVLRLNDSFPGDRLGQWVWQRGPWLLVDRVTGHVAPLKLPDYDPGVSHVSWFRDYGAYCGVTASGKSLYAVVAQLAGRKPVLARKLDAFDPDPKNHSDPVCIAPDWQRDPLRVTFHATDKGDVSFDIVAGSAVLVEDSGDDPEPGTTNQPAQRIEFTHRSPDARNGVIARVRSFKNLHPLHRRIGESLSQRTPFEDFAENRNRM